MNRLLVTLSASLLLAGCAHFDQSCLKVKPGMNPSQVVTVMGEARDSFLIGDPPAGIMLVYGPETRDKWPQDPNGPIAIELEDAPSGNPDDRAVRHTYCRVH